MKKNVTNRNLSRRRFIKGAGALAIAGIAAGIMGLGNKKENNIHAAEADEDKIDRQWVMVIDLRRCTGYYDCVDGCREMHYLREGQEWAKTDKIENATGDTIFFPHNCMQCENAPCVRVCPVHATYKSRDGVTLVDVNKCIGCRMCMAACPYHARTFNWDDPPKAPPNLSYTPIYPVPQKKGTVGKCEFCLHDIRVGKVPACVDRCPNHARYVGDLISDLATDGVETVKLSTLLKDNDAFRLKEELNTKPRVWYIAGHGQDVEEG